MRVNHSHTSSTLNRKKESRKRNLHFHLPAAVSCAPNLRLLQNDTSYISLGDIYDQHCEDSGMAREEPVLMVGEKVKATVREFKQRNGHPVRNPVPSGLTRADYCLANEA